MLIGDKVVVFAVTPLLHKYVPPPLAVSVDDTPEHIVVGAVMPTVGLAFTTTLVDVVLVQPNGLVTVNVYNPAVFFMILAEVSPELQIYVPPPVPVRVALNPLQIVALPVIFAVGKAFTTTLVVVVFLQPVAPVTVTV